MKTLYLECKMGAAGDMLTSALLGLVEEPDKVLDELNSLGIPGVIYNLEKTRKCGIEGNHLSVMIHGHQEGEEDDHIDAGDHKHGHDHVHDHDHNHNHTHENVNDHYHEHDHEHSSNTLYEIEDIIENLNVSKDVKSDIREVYALLAEAESKVHGENVSQIHFHEVGDMDAIADVSAVCYLMHVISPDRTIVSTINVGSGTVKCAHGILPVPAPATAYLLSGVPYYESATIMSELCTPTGAALLKYFADDFSSQPVMVVDRIGYGMGKKDFDQLNAVRAVLGTTNEASEQIVELAFNVDDMTAEEIGYAQEVLFNAGALEVYTIAADMKKNRPGQVVYCICKLEDRERLLNVAFKHTTTLGIRETICNRYVLSRVIEKIETPYGDVRIKKSSGYGVSRSKLEYDDLAGIANTTGKSIIELKKEIDNL